jgi:hypothetical protein
MSEWMTFKNNHFIYRQIGLLGIPAVLLLILLFYIIFQIANTYQL